MPRAFEAVYTPAQREAVDFAYNDRKVRPARRVRELAEAGELTDRSGDKLPAFTINDRTIRSIASKAERKRLGIGKTKLTEMADRDAKAELKRRLTAIADHGTQALLDRQSKGKGETDWEEVRLMARAVREIVAIPEPKHESAARPPGVNRQGHNEGATRGGTAGKLMRAHRDETAPDRNTAPYHRDATAGPSTLEQEPASESARSGSLAHA